jgi:DNA replication protein DnaC
MELTTLLKRLRLEHLEAQLDGLCEQAVKGDLDDKGFLAEALEAEWRGRYQRGVESRLKLARSPWIKTLAEFDFDFQPSLDRKDIRELAGLSWIERAHNVVPLGPPGGNLSMSALGTRTVANRGHLTFAFSGHDSFRLTGRGGSGEASVLKTDDHDNEFKTSGAGLQRALRGARGRAGARVRRSPSDSSSAT